jgi:hypothetical protein
MASRARGRLAPAALALATLLAAGARADAPADVAAGVAPPAGADDEVTLRDGSRLRGRIVQQTPGRPVMLVDREGRRHLLAWDAIDEVVLARSAAQPTARASVLGGGLVSYELHASVAGLLMPSRSFVAGGTCKTLTGTAAVSRYDIPDKGRGGGAGPSVGGRVAWLRARVPRPEEGSTWWAVRVGAGVDLDYLVMRVPTGIPDVDGDLCAHVQAQPSSTGYTVGPSLVAQLPLVLGGHVGLGGFDGASAWKGVVLGAAWSPSLLYASVPEGKAITTVALVGLDLTLDVSRLEGAREVGATPQLRLNLFLSAPLRSDDPAIARLGVGAVWY